MNRQPIGMRFLLPNMRQGQIRMLLPALDFRAYCREISDDEICG